MTTVASEAGYEQVGAGISQNKVMSRPTYKGLNLFRNMVGDYTTHLHARRKITNRESFHSRKFTFY